MQMVSRVVVLGAAVQMQMVACRTMVGTVGGPVAKMMKQQEVAVGSELGAVDDMVSLAAMTVAGVVAACIVVEAVGVVSARRWQEAEKVAVWVVVADVLEMLLFW